MNQSLIKCFSIYQRLTFKKVYYDELLGRAASKFVPAEDLIVPYSATSLDDTDAIVHVIKMSGNELRKQQVAGFYRDVKLSDPPVTENQLMQEITIRRYFKRWSRRSIHTL